MNKSIGIIETIGYTGAINAMDIMLKMAYVDVAKVEYVGSGIVCIIVEGDIDSVKEALRVGEEVLYSFGGIISSHCIGKPFAKI